MKKRSKVSAEFSMSSLTDIIFLLLIFFMLTSKMVQINYQLPESDSKTVAPSDLVVEILGEGTYKFNGKLIKKNKIKSRIKKELAKMSNKENASLAIAAEVAVPWSKVNDVMKIAMSLKMKAHIATQPRK